MSGKAQDPMDESAMQVSGTPPAPSRQGRSSPASLQRGAAGQAAAGTSSLLQLLESLPEELLVHLLTFAGARQLCALGMVSRAWHARLRTNDAHLWRPLALALWSSCSPTSKSSSTSSSASSSSSAITSDASLQQEVSGGADVARVRQSVQEMEAMKRDVDREYGPSECSWRRFYGVVVRLERNWAAMRFVRRRWYHNKTEALTMRYSVEALMSWEDDEDAEDPEGWDKSCVGALDVGIGGGRLVTGGDDGSVRVWDPYGRMHGSYADEWNWNCISCICHDDQIVVGAYTDRPVPTKTGVMVWDLSTGEQKHKFENSEQVVYMVLRSPLLAACCGSNIDLWDLNTGTLVNQLDVIYPASQVSLHPTDSNLAVTGSIFSRKIKLWDVRSPEHYVAKACLQENLSREFAYDGSSLVAGEVVEMGIGGGIKEWDMRNLSKPRLRLRPRPEISVGDVLAVDFDHRNIVSLHESGGFYVWSRVDGTVMGHISKLSVNAEHIAMDKDHGYCFVGGENRGIYRITLPTSKSTALMESMREVEKPLTNEGPLDFCDVMGLRVTRRGLYATFRDGAIYHYDFVPAFSETH